MAKFYDTEVAAWQVILGKTMHYNFGTRDPKSSNNDPEAHLNFGTRSLYQWIPTGATVLDAGCGWGGPARLLINERKARVHGVTASQVQADFAQEFVPGATWSCEDLAELTLHEDFDVTIALESLTHVERPYEALRRIRKRTARLILRDHVMEGSGGEFPSWKMRVPSIDEFQTLVESAGFHVEHHELIDVPWESSARFWLNNIRAAFPVFTPAGQFQVLERTCTEILSRGHPPQKISLLVAS